MVFVYIFPMTSDSEYFFHVPVGYLCTSSIEHYLFMYFAHVITELFVLLQNFLHIPYNLFINYLQRFSPILFVAFLHCYWFPFQSRSYLAWYNNICVLLLFVFCSNGLYLWHLFQEVLNILLCLRVSLIFSFRNLMISDCRTRSLICLEFIFL